MLAAMNRRAFLGSVAAGPALLAIGSVRADAQSGAQSSGQSPTKTPDRSGLKLGTVTYNIAKDWDIPTLIKNLGETGFEAVELRTTHKHGVEPSLSLVSRVE